VLFFFHFEPSLGTDHELLRIIRNKVSQILSTLDPTSLVTKSHRSGFQSRPNVP